MIYREIFNMQWSHLTQFGPAAKEAYLRRCSAGLTLVHSREDITDWENK